MAEESCTDSGKEAEPEEIRALVGLLRRLADEAARRHRIWDYREDLAQDGFEAFWRERHRRRRRPAEGELRGLIDRLAARERKRRQRAVVQLEGHASPAPSRRRGREGRPLDATSFKPPAPRPPRVGIPPLCPRLASLGRNSRYESRLSNSLLVATIVVAPDVLTAEQFGTFVFAYVQGQPASEIAVALRTSPCGVRRRLERCSRKIEKLLTERLLPLLPSYSQAWVLKAVLTGHAQKKQQNVATSKDEAACEDVLAALEAVIHSHPGTPTS